MAMSQLKKRMLRLGVLMALCGAAAVALVWDFDASKKGTQQEQSKVKVFSITQAEDVKEITLTRGGETFHIVRHDERDAYRKWQLTVPMETVADANIVDAIIRFLVQMERTAVVGDRPASDNKAITPPTNLALFGLDPPTFTVVLTTKQGATETLLIGKKSTFNDSMYVKRDNAPDVMLVPGGLEYQVDKDLLALREKRLVLFNNGDVEKMEITTPAKKQHVVIARDATTITVGWRITSPKAIRADQLQVNGILTNLGEARADVFVAQAPQPKDIVQYHLDKPTARVALHLRGASAPIVLLFGEDTQHHTFYAMEEGQHPIMQLASGALFSMLTMGIESLRDNHILSFDRDAVAAVVLRKGDTVIRLEKQRQSGAGGDVADAADEGHWQIVKPTSQPASDASVSGLLYKLFNLESQSIVVDSAAEKDFVAYGLDKPSSQVELWGTGGNLLATLLMREVDAAAAADGDGKNKKPEPQYRVAQRGGDRIDMIAKTLGDEISFDAIEYQQTQPASAPKEP